MCQASLDANSIAFFFSTMSTTREYITCPPEGKKTKTNHDEDPLLSAESLPSYAHLDSHHISLLLETQSDALSNPWKGSIKFKCFIFSGDEEKIPLLLSGCPFDVDICDYLGGHRYPARSVHLNGTLSSSCCAFENLGIFCEHQCATVTLIYGIQDKTFE